MYNTDMPTRAELPSQRQLLRSTGIALVTAAVLLVTVVMPSEYGIDPTGVGKVLGLTPMGEIKASLAAEGEADAKAPAPAPAAAAATAPLAEAGPAVDVAVRSDVTTVVLKPGEGVEYKGIMMKGAKVSYEWSTDGPPVNHDTHGDPVNGPANAFHSYKKEKQVTGDKGEFTAVFEGKHGWFWRNRSDKTVTITLKTSGQYVNLHKM